MSMEVIFTVLGEPASKSNSRQLVRLNGRPAFIKSKKALDYVNSFKLQCKPLKNLMEGDLEVSIKIFYRSRRPDLDESVILDCMQGLIYSNDRQVKQKHIFHGVDPDNPRSEITVRVLDLQTTAG